MGKVSKSLVVRIVMSRAITAQVIEREAARQLDLEREPLLGIS